MPNPGFPGHPLKEGPEWAFRSPPTFSLAPTITAVNPPSARTFGGGTLTITGSNFRLLGDGTAPTVLVGGVVASNVVVVSSTTLTCTIPASSTVGLVDVTVQVQTLSATLVGCFTYFASKITAIIPDWGPTTGGTTVVIEGANFIDGTLVLFDGVLATEVHVLDAQHISCVTPARATYGFVDVQLLEPLV